MIKIRAQKALKAPKASKSLKAVKTTRVALPKKPAVSNTRTVRVTAPIGGESDQKHEKRNDSVYKSQMKLAESIVSRYSDVFKELAK